MNIQSLDIDLDCMVGKVTFIDGTVQDIKGYPECEKYYQMIYEYEAMQSAARSGLHRVSGTPVGEQKL